MSNPIMEVGGPMPPSIGRCADLYHDIRDLRLAMDKEVSAIKARETEVKNHIIDSLSVSDDTGAAGLKFRAQLTTKSKPILSSASDDLPSGGWGVFCSWVRKNDRFDMLQKRLADKAVLDFYEEDGRLPPGIEKMTVKDVSITKV